MLATLRRRFLGAAVLCGAVALAAACPVVGQSAAGSSPTFAYEVVSLKPHGPGDGHVGIHTDDDSYRATNVSLKSLIADAFDLKMDDFVQGLSGPMADARFDINAKMDAETVAALNKLHGLQRDEQEANMMRALLEDRFKLKVHREKKETTVFALVVAKSGFKLKPADPNDTYANGIKGPDGVAHSGSVHSTDTSIRGQGIPMSSLASHLQHQRGISRMVIDKTGQPDTYDFEIHWVNEDHSDDAATPAGSSLFAVLEEQLGLKLETTKAQVDTIVVDHVEKPSED